MPAAFAIAAILCPTDAVAVSAITNGKVLPKGSMSILEGESLLMTQQVSFHLKLRSLRLSLVHFQQLTLSNNLLFRQSSEY